VSLLRTCLILLASLCLASCGGGRELELGSAGAGGVTIERVDASELPGPNGELGEAQRYTYVIGSFDRLVIDVMGFEGMIGRRVQVDGAGNISLPVGGVVQIAGLTLPEAVARVRERMRAAYVRDPQVAINLEESLSQYVTVEGEVELPGNYPMVAQMTLMRAIAAARGPTDFARLQQVVIHRNVNGQRMVALYDLDAVRRGAYPDPMLYPRDIITVGDSPSRRMFQQFIQLSPLLASPIVAIVNTL
jgi:polysaccharide biosynthesis/export protein